MPKKTESQLTSLEEGYINNYRDSVKAPLRADFDRFHDYMKSQKPYEPRTRLTYLKHYRLYLNATGKAYLTQTNVDRFYEEHLKNPVRNAMLKCVGSMTEHHAKHPSGTPFEGLSIEERHRIIRDAQEVDLPEVKSSARSQPKRWLSKTQVQSWIQRVQSDEKLPRWYLPLILLLADSGMRIGEALSLKRSDLKFSDRVKIRVKGGPKQFKQVTPIIIETLRQYCSNEGIKMKDYVFAGDDGNPLPQPRVRYYFHKYGAGEHSVHPHMLRRYVATRLHQRDVETIIIKQILGHKNIQTTEAYIDVDPAKVTRAKTELGADEWENYK